MIRDESLTYIIVEGNVGAGKSTFLKLIKQLLPVDIIYEPHQQWQQVGGTENLLERFYNDTNRWAYTFQSYAFVTRVKELELAAKKASQNIQVLERSVFSDRYCFAQNCFELGSMNSLEWKLYQEWFGWLVENYTVKPHGFIYLRTDPAVCYRRMLKRNRSEESCVSLEYLHMLHDKHEDWLIHKKNISSYLNEIPVLILDCNKEFEADISQMDAHAERIGNFLTTIQTSAQNQNLSCKKTLNESTIE